MMVDGKEVKAVEELKWYPGGLAYRLGCDRRFIRKQPNLVKSLVDCHNEDIVHCQSGALMFTHTHPPTQCTGFRRQWVGLFEMYGKRVTSICGTISSSLPT